MPILRICNRLATSYYSHIIIMIRIPHYHTFINNIIVRFQFLYLSHKINNNMAKVYNNQHRHFDQWHEHNIICMGEATCKQYNGVERTLMVDNLIHFHYDGLCHRTLITILPCYVTVV